MSNKTNNLKAYLRDLYEGIVSKKPDASRNPQNFRSEIEAIRTGGELYEVMDASELPEDAPNGSLALVEGEPIPEAYTVSSVDELPSNAVDGSMAIVPSDSLIGEWLFSETPNFDVLELSDNTQIIINTLGFNDESGCFGALYISKIDGSFVISPKLTNGEKYDLYVDNMWDGSSRIKCFNVGNMWAREIDGTDIDYPEIEKDVKLFFNTNADRLSGGYALYTHENGEWVYKCEVV